MTTDSQSLSREPHRLPGWIPVASCLAVLAATPLAFRVVDGPLALLLPVGALGFLVALLRVFTQPIHILAWFLLVVVNLDFFKLGGGGLTLDVAASSVLLSLLLVWFLSAGRGARSASTRLEGWMLVFLATALVSVILSTMPGASLKRFGREVEYFAVAALILRVSMRPEHARLLLYAVLLSCVVPCVLGILGYAFRIDAFLGQDLFLQSTFEGEARVRSTLSHPVTLSLYLTVTLTITCAAFLSGRYLPRAVSGSLLLLQFVTLYLTYGRSGWAGFLAAFVALLWFSGRRKILLLGLPVAAFAAWKVIPNLEERLSTAAASGPENSLLWRLGLWEFALQKFPDRPVFGSGLGTFLEYVHYQEGFNPHQTWIGRLIETGIVGTLAFLGLVVVAWLELRKARRRAGPEWLPLVQGASAAWMGMIFGSLTADPFSLPTAAVYFWTVAALAIVVSRWRSAGVFQGGAA